MIYSHSLSVAHPRPVRAKFIRYETLDVYHVCSSVRADRAYFGVRKPRREFGAVKQQLPASEQQRGAAGRSSAERRAAESFNHPTANSADASAAAGQNTGERFEAR